MVKPGRPFSVSASTVTLLEASLGVGLGVGSVPFLPVDFDSVEEDGIEDGGLGTTCCLWTLVMSRDISPRSSLINSLLMATVPPTKVATPMATSTSKGIAPFWLFTLSECKVGINYHCKSFFIRCQQSPDYFLILTLLLSIIHFWLIQSGPAI